MLPCWVYPRGYAKILGLWMEEGIADFQRGGLRPFPETLKFRFASVFLSCYSKKPPPSKIDSEPWRQSSPNVEKPTSFASHCQFCYQKWALRLKSGFILELSGLVPWQEDLWIGSRWGELSASRVWIQWGSCDDSVNLKLHFTCHVSV